MFQRYIRPRNELRSLLRTMQFSAAQIAGMLQGEIVGNPDVTVASLSKIEEGKPGTLTFLSNPKYTEYIYTTEASIAIVSAEFKPEQTLPAALTLIKVADLHCRPR